MKVDDPRVSHGTEILRTPAETSRPGQAGRVRTDGDSVTLSRDLQLATDAIKAASVQVEPRPDTIERARQLVADGSLDANLDALADALIDSLLESHDPAP